MDYYFQLISKSYSGYFNYLMHEVTHPSFHNYFYWLLTVSALISGLEFFFPWRKEQKLFQSDFLMDVFYLFFNFFLFSLVGFAAISNLFVDFYSSILGTFGLKNQVAIHFENLPIVLQFVLMFVLADFIQWNIHRLLHKVPFLWRFHKVHHSTQVMSWLGHFRFHWMESVIYKTIQYIPLALFGFGITNFFILHIIAVAIGHLNHANLNWTYGPFKYIFNSPVMHLQHHAIEVPKNKTGVNFGLSLSIWDYIFKTAYVLKSNPTEPLGFEKIEEYPKTLFEQWKKPFISK